MRKKELIIVFAIQFVLLAVWTAIVFGGIQDDLELISLVAAEDIDWEDQYRELTDSERQTLMNRINVDTIKKDELVIISMKPHQLHPTANIIIDDNLNYTIWASASCYELRKLVLKHQLSFEQVNLSNGKPIYVMIDSGTLQSKSLNEVKELANRPEIKMQCKKVLSARRHTYNHVGTGGY